MHNLFTNELKKIESKTNELLEILLDLEPKVAKLEKTKEIGRHYGLKKSHSNKYYKIADDIEEIRKIVDTISIRKFSDLRYDIRLLSEEIIDDFEK